MNYGNRNSTCAYGQDDITKGYVVAVTAALIVSLSIRKMTSGLLKGCTANKMIVLNSLVGASASCAAGFCNTYAMRNIETKKGISVFSDEDL